MLVYRGNRDELVIEVRSDEELGTLDTGFIEDYYGTDGQVSLHHLATGVRYGVLMVEDASETPTVSHDFFRGLTAMAFLPDGDYRVEGLVRDVLGHYTVLSAHSDPPLGGGLAVHEFSILLGEALPPRQSDLAMYRDKAMMITVPTPAYLSTIERAFIRPYGENL